MPEDIAELLERHSSDEHVNGGLLHVGAEEIKRLQAIVDKLPKTADGVPITPGMNLYCNRAGHTQGAGPLATWHDCHKLFLTFRDTSGREWHSSPDTCYSTREAMEAARDV